MTVDVRVLVAHRDKVLSLPERIVPLGAREATVRCGDPTGKQSRVVRLASRDDEHVEISTAQGRRADHLRDASSLRAGHPARSERRSAWARRGQPSVFVGPPCPPIRTMIPGSDQILRRVPLSGRTVRGGGTGDHRSAGMSTWPYTRLRCPGQTRQVRVVRTRRIGSNRVMITVTWRVANGGSRAAGTGEALGRAVSNFTRRRRHSNLQSRRLDAARRRRSIMPPASMAGWLLSSPSIPNTAAIRGDFHCPSTSSGPTYSWRGASAAVVAVRPRPGGSEPPCPAVGS